MTPLERRTARGESSFLAFRIAYRLEPTESAEDTDRRPPTQDPFQALLRIPSEDPWVVRRDLDSRTPSIVMEGDFPSPNDLDWDYWMGGEGESTRFSYAETWLGPAAPLQMLRFLAQALVRHEDRLAGDALRRMESATLRRKDVRKGVRETVTLPFAESVARIARRPVYGPRERGPRPSTRSTSTPPS